PEFDRAREMRSLFDQSHALLDIHSTTQDVPPFFVLSPGERNHASLALADGIGFPPLQLLMRGGMQTGTPVIDYGPFNPNRASAVTNATPFPPGAGGSLVVECGQHFSKRAGEVATQVSLAFLRQTGVLSAQSASAWSMKLTGSDAIEATAVKPQRFELLSTHVIRTSELRWVRPLRGMEVFAKDELIGHDGDFEIRSPCDECTVFMPLAAYRRAVPGREGVYLTKPLR
ncbi:MAG: hypothetical protein ACRDAM_19970, partial [Casimicrobium sp.]